MPGFYFCQSLQYRNAVVTGWMVWLHASDVGNEDERKRAAFKVSAESAVNGIRGAARKQRCPREVKERCK